MNRFQRFAARIKSLTLLGALLLGVSAFRYSQVGSSQEKEPAKAAVTAAYKAYLRAWKDKDCESLNRLISDNYQAVDFRGIVSTKANEIKTAREDQKYDTMTGDVRSVILFDKSAVVSGLIRATWVDEKGEPQKITVRFLAMLQKQSGEWKLVATQSTRFMEPVGEEWNQEPALTFITRSPSRTEESARRFNRFFSSHFHAGACAR